MSMKGKKIVLGITGSIAAYKAAILIRGLIKKGAEVQVVITPAGKEFITPITLSALTSKPVISEFFAQRDGTWNSHVDLGLWADAMIIAPATASTIGKMANGIADNMLITTCTSGYDDYSFAWVCFYGTLFIWLAVAIEGARDMAGSSFGGNTYFFSDNGDLLS